MDLNLSHLVTPGPESLLVGNSSLFWVTFLNWTLEKTRREKKKREENKRKTKKEKKSGEHCLKNTASKRLSLEKGL